MPREAMRARLAAERVVARRRAAAARRKALGVLPKFRLTDPLKRWDERPPRPPVASPPRVLPRIRCLTDDAPNYPAPPRPRPPPSPNDEVDATRLSLRLAAFARALDDLPGEARRFIRWKQIRERQRAAGRFVALTPLRPGRAPGGRLGRWDLFTKHPARIRDIDKTLAECHHLARYALENPDTS